MLAFRSILKRLQKLGTKNEQSWLFGSINCKRDLEIDGQSKRIPQGNTFTWKIHLPHSISSYHCSELIHDVIESSPLLLTKRAFKFDSSWKRHTNHEGTQYHHNWIPFSFCVERGFLIPISLFDQKWLRKPISHIWEPIASKSSTCVAAYENQETKIWLFQNLLGNSMVKNMCCHECFRLMSVVGVAPALLPFEMMRATMMNSGPPRFAPT